MKVGEALSQIMVMGVFHVLNCQMVEKGELMARIQDIITELFAFINSQGFEDLDLEIPGLTREEVSEMAKAYSFSLNVRENLVSCDDDRYAIIRAFQYTLPQAYLDLVNNGEVIEARLRAESLC